MTPTLSDIERHVLAGDVLLLRSRGGLAFWNRFGQRLLRPLRLFQRAKYTHVALVLNETHIADATPEAGVRIRRWDDAAATYDLDRCVVARHPKMQTDFGGEVLLARVQYYYDQKYGLTALARRSVKDEAGIVCSQFVAMVLADLGLPPLVGNAMRALPSDIDKKTRSPKSPKGLKGSKNAQGWRQFPFCSYGLNPSLTKPPTGDDYRAALAEAHHQMAARLLQEPPDAEASAAPMAEAGAGDDSCTPDPRWAHLPLEKKLPFALGELMASSMGENAATLRALADLDRTLLKMSTSLQQARAAADPDELATLAQALGGDGGIAADMSVLSGEALLDRWKALFTEASAGGARVLADADAPERLQQHRQLFADELRELIGQATHLNQSVDSLKQAMERMVEHGTPEMDFSEPVAALHRAALALQGGPGAAWLGQESADVILKRTPDYGRLVEAHLIPWAQGAGGAEVGQQGLAVIEDLLKLDEQRLNWVSGSQAILQLLTTSLAAVLATGSSPSAAESSPARR